MPSAGQESENPGTFVTYWLTLNFINSKVTSSKAVVPSGIFKTPQVTQYGAKIKNHGCKWGEMVEWFIRKLVGRRSWVAEFKLKLLAASCQQENTCLKMEPTHSGAPELGTITQ